MFDVYVINSNGPGAHLRSFATEQEARVYMQKVAMDFYWGVCVKNPEGKFDFDGSGNFDDIWVPRF